MYSMYVMQAELQPGRGADPGGLDQRGALPGGGGPAPARPPQDCRVPPAHPKQAP